MGRLTARVLALMLPLAYAAPRAGADEWVRVRSPHFTVFTDAGEKRGREVAHKFEQLRAVFEKMLATEKLSSPVPLEILAFKGSDQFRQVAQQNNRMESRVAGVFLAGGDLDFIALDLSFAGDSPIVYHEYIHTVLRANFRSLPRWLDEGFAKYYETIRIDKGHIQIGGSPQHVSTFFSGRGLMPVAELFAVKAYPGEDQRLTLFYDESWLVVHYVFDKGKVAGLSKYMELTSQRRVGIPEAIEQAFGMGAKTFDTQLAAYLNLGQRQIFNIDDPSAVPAESYSAEPMDESDAAAMIANFQFHDSNRRPEAIAGYQAILTKNPDQVDANLGLGWNAFQEKRFDDSEKYFRKALARDPKGARSNLLFGLLQMQRDSTDENRQDRLVDAWNHLKIATKSAPEFAEAHSLLAQVLDRLKVKDQAIAEATTAARLNQGDEQYFMNLAQIYCDAKQFGPAKVLFEELSSSPNPLLAALAKKRLEDLQTDEEQPKAPSKND